MNITSIISTLLAFTVANKGFWQLCEYKTPPYHTRKIVRWKAMSNCNWLLNTILFVICVCLYFSELALRQSWPFHYIQQRLSFTFYAIHHEENSWTILIVLMTAVFCLRVLELFLAMQSYFSPPEPQDGMINHYWYCFCWDCYLGLLEWSLIVEHTSLVNARALGIVLTSYLQKICQLWDQIVVSCRDGKWICLKPGLAFSLLFSRDRQLLIFAISS